MKRRDFLKAGMLGAAGFAFSGLTFMVPRRADAAVVNVAFTAERVLKTMIDGTQVPAWQFSDANNSGPGALTSGLVVQEGDTVKITVYNTLDRAINFFIPGVDISGPLTDISSGGSGTYSFTAPAAGSYMYYDDASDDIGRAMGLSGPLVVMPANSPDALYSGGPTFDRQYTLVLNELDNRLNRAIDSGQSYNMDNYEPNYFFANGLSYPETAKDGDTLVAMVVGENVAIRFINTGMITSPMHFHGYHVKVTSRNRAPETAVIDKDTVFVDVGECVDVILPVAQAGAYPMHTHFVPGVTANGTYLNPYGGALIVMSAT